METITLLISYVLGIAVASERIVEMIKGVFPILWQAKDDSKQEAFRRSLLQALSIVISVGVAFTATATLPNELKTLGWVERAPGVIALGLMAAGGSGFWNVLLTLMQNIKDLKKGEVESKRKNPAPALVSGAPAGAVKPN
ncbi:hypothetical protein J4P02_03625 [Pseudomonas sp. NFXW11]|uniref:hypothetical protein n=1 Tax=Pseudomonas sp. NFXW11 TaxID=2819531 RepID=UPI003CEB36BE